MAKTFFQFSHSFFWILDDDFRTSNNIDTSKFVLIPWYYVHMKMRYTCACKITNIVTGSGFIDVSPNNKVTILADSAVRADDIDIKKAQDAKRRAEKMLLDKERLSKTEILSADASLRKAVLELKVGRRKHTKYHSSPSQFT